MKIFNMDFAYKAIIVEIGEKQYHINFKNSLFKGIYDIKVFEFSRTQKANNEEIQIYSTSKGIISNMNLLVKHIWSELKMKLYVALENNLFHKKEDEKNKSN